MARKTIKVEVPHGEPEALIKLGQDVCKQHAKLATASPISDGVVKMSDYIKRINDAASLQTAIDELAAALQEKTGLRDQLLGMAQGQNSQSRGTVLFETMQIRDLLLAVNRGNEEELEPWGFSVTIGSAAAPKRKTQT